MFVRFRSIAPFLALAAFLTASSARGDGDASGRDQTAPSPLTSGDCVGLLGLDWRLNPMLKGDTDPVKIQRIVTGCDGGDAVLMQFLKQELADEKTLRAIAQGAGSLAEPVDCMKRLSPTRRLSDDEKRALNALCPLGSATSMGAHEVIRAREAANRVLAEYQAGLKARHEIALAERDDPRAKYMLRPSISLFWLGASCFAAGILLTAAVFMFASRQDSADELAGKGGKNRR